MRVYLLTKGCYSDYHVEACTLDKDIAEAYARFHCCDIETQELVEDKSVIDAAKGLYKRFCFYFRRNGALSEVVVDYVRERSEATIDDTYSLLKILVCNEDKDKALKIARDKRAQYFSEKYGL